MRLPKLLMGSLLAVPLACAGDDGSTMDTGNDTGSTGMTPSTMSMSGADDDGDGGMTTGGGDDDGMNTTGEPPGGSSGEPPADSSGSGEPPADSSGSGGGSDTGGAVSQECMDFCADYIDQCGDNPANDYVDAAGCETACTGYSEKEFDCKEMHLGFVESMGPAHCAHANIDGDGVC